MAPPRKPDALKYCGYCQERLVRKRDESTALFARRKYCGFRCTGLAKSARPSQATSLSTGHHHARKAVGPGPCATCGKLVGEDVHHLDGNHLNNALSNLIRLCRSCHSRAHQKPRAVCTLCGNPARGLGYCDKHYTRLKRNGDPRAVRRRADGPLIFLD